MKFLKKIIKKILLKNNWKLEKIVIPKKYNQESPKKELVEAMINSSGILHIGAHRGSEAPVYEWFGKKVVWIEANPNIYENLRENLIKYELQTSFCRLITDKDDQEYSFKISNNDGASSSIYNFSNINSEEMFLDRNFSMKEEIKIKSISLDNFFKKEKIDPKNFNHWVIDVQGSELDLFKGAKNSLKFCKSLIVEVSTKDIYEGGAIWKDVKNFLKGENFEPINEPEKIHTDILFLRK